MFLNMFFEGIAGNVMILSRTKGLGNALVLWLNGFQTPPFRRCELGWFSGAQFCPSQQVFMIFCPKIRLVRSKKRSLFTPLDIPSLFYL